MKAWNSISLQQSQKEWRKPVSITWHSLCHSHLSLFFFFQSFSFNSERLPQYKRESDKKSKFLFLHYSATKGFWDWWILILTTYIAIMVPYNVAFRRNDRKRDLIIFDTVIELFFIMDIVVHFRTSFVDISGRIIYDQKKIAIHYLKGWFILDFLAALPFEALYFVNHTWVSIIFHCH